MAEKVAGANSMVRHKGKMIQIQSQLIDQTIVTVVIMDGQVKSRFETDATEQLKTEDPYPVIQKMLNDQHKTIEIKIRAKAKQKEKEAGGANEVAEAVEEEIAQEPKKRGLLDTILRRKKK